MYGVSDISGYWCLCNPSNSLQYSFISWRAHFGVLIVLLAPGLPFGRESTLDKTFDYFCWVFSSDSIVVISVCDGSCLPQNKKKRINLFFFFSFFFEYGMCYFITQCYASFLQSLAVINLILLHMFSWYVCPAMSIVTSCMLVQQDCTMCCLFRVFDQTFRCRNLFLHKRIKNTIHKATLNKEDNLQMCVFFS